MVKFGFYNLFESYKRKMKNNIFQTKYLAWKKFKLGKVIQNYQAILIVDDFKIPF